MISRVPLLQAAIAVALLSSALRADHPVEAPKPQDPAEQTKRLTIDVGRFSPYARGIVIQIDKSKSGDKRLQVQVDKPGRSDTSINIDVNRDGTTKPKVNVDVRQNGRQKVDLRIGGSDSSVEATEPREENYLGVFTRPLPKAITAQLSRLLKEQGGLLVVSVLAKSPAASAGLKEHDILVTYDDHKLTSVKQLKKLILDDKPGRTVKLGLIRAAAPLTLDIPLGQREVVSPVRYKTVRITNGNQLDLLQSRGITPIIINKRLIQVPGVQLRLDASGDKQEQEESEQGHQTIRDRKLLITSEDGQRFQVKAEYTADDGARVERSLAGTPKELEEKIKVLPADLQEDIRGALKKATSEKQQNRKFRFQIEPRVEKNSRSFHISINRPGPGNQSRIVEVERRFDGDKSIQVGDLLKIDIVADELRELSPNVRAKVEATLNRVQIPEVRVDVESSQ